MKEHLDKIISLLDGKTESNTWIGRHFKQVAIVILAIVLTLSFMSCSTHKQVSDLDIGINNGLDFSPEMSTDSVADGGWFSGISGSSSGSYGGSYEGSYESDNKSEILDEQSPNIEDSNNKQDDTVDEYGDTYIIDEKLVYTCNISIETKVYNDSYTKLRTLLEEYGGIVESEETRDNSYDWYVDNSQYKPSRLTRLHCRVPSDKYNEFVDLLGKLGEDTKVVSKNTSTDNITQTYVDSKAELEALQVQEESLLGMLEKADTVSDMLTIEERLTNVRSRMNSLKTTIRKMDMDVAYSYVNITLDEVESYSVIEDETFLTRLWESLKESFNSAIDTIEDAITSLVVLIPVLILNVLPLLLILKLIINIVKKHKNKVKVKAKENVDKTE